MHASLNGTCGTGFPRRGIFNPQASAPLIKGYYDIASIGLVQCSITVVFSGAPQ